MIRRLLRHPLAEAERLLARVIRRKFLQRDDETEWVTRCMHRNSGDPFDCRKPVISRRIVKRHHGMDAVEYSDGLCDGCDMTRRIMDGQPYTLDFGQGA